MTSSSLLLSSLDLSALVWFAVAVAAVAVVEEWDWTECMSPPMMVVVTARVDTSAEPMVQHLL